jgi:hypothetical protein
MKMLKKLIIYLASTFAMFSCRSFFSLYVCGKVAAKHKMRVFFKIYLRTEKYFTS